MEAVALTERQTRVLWMLSMGRSHQDIVDRTGMSLWSVKDAGRRLLRVLKAETTAQAVRNGLLDGHIGPYEDCRSLAAYRRHLKNNEAVCAACKRGNLERVEAEAAARNRRTELTEAEVRLMRAFDAGRTVEQVCERWGLSQDTVRKLVESAYRALGADLLPRNVRRESALREARARGLLAPREPVRPLTPEIRIRLSPTHVRILTVLSTGASISEAANKLDMHPGTCATRLSEAYRRLDVAWMDKGVRRAAALRKARELNLIPEPATV